MRESFIGLCFLALLAPALAGDRVRAAEPTPAVPGAAAPVLDKAPTVASVTETLGRVRDHLDRTQSLAVTDRTSRQPITDFTTPNPNATVRIGSYPMGVLLASMLLAGDATGDKRYTDFTITAGPPATRPPRRATTGAASTAGA